MGNSVLFYKVPHGKSQPRWWGPALILDIDETGVMVKYQTQSFKVARNCVRKQVKETGVGNGKRDTQDDERFHRLNPISLDTLGDTWRSMEPRMVWQRMRPPPLRE